MKFLKDSPIIVNFKSIIFLWVRKPDSREGQVNSRIETGKKHHFLGKSGTIVKNVPWSDLCPQFYHIPDTNYPSFCLKCSKIFQKALILDIFKYFPNFVPLPLPNFGVDFKFDHIHLCVCY